MRFGPQEIENQAEQVKTNQLLRRVIDGIPGLVMVLNSQRQIIGMNRGIRELLGIQRSESLMGFRPGEALGCVHAQDHVDGCGEGEFCQLCGALKSISEAWSTRGSSVQEVPMSLGRGSGEYQVASTWMMEGGFEFLFVVLKDISSEKRREVLEKTFFHDLLNTATGICGISEILASDKHLETRGDLQPLSNLLRSSAEVLVEEIQSQQSLLQAEKGLLVPQIKTIPLGNLILSIKDFYQSHPVAYQKIISLAEAPDGFFESDDVLIRRVLGNMLKNALEASEFHDTVTMGVRWENQN